MGFCDTDNMIHISMDCVICLLFHARGHRAHFIPAPWDCGAHAHDLATVDIVNHGLKKENLIMTDNRKGNRRERAGQGRKQKLHEPNTPKDPRPQKSDFSRDPPSPPNFLSKIENRYHEIWEWEDKRWANVRIVFISARTRCWTLLPAISVGLTPRLIITQAVMLGGLMSISMTGVGISNV